MPASGFSAGERLWLWRQRAALAPTGGFSAGKRLYRRAA